VLHRVPLPAQLDRVILAGGAVAGIVATPIIVIPLIFLVFDEISASEYVFWVLAALIVLGALGAVLLSNIVHATLSLVMTLLGVAGIYLLLSSEFLALVQVLVYGGGVVILVLFGLMLTNAANDPIVTDGSQKPFAFGVAAIMAGTFATAMVAAQWGESEPVLIPFRVFGERLFRDFSVPVIIVAILLDIAFTGAFVNARRAEAATSSTEDAQ
jgi:NADH-quinone oxidoreductase subunit J